jgi:hypothetical protein
VAPEDPRPRIELLSNYTSCISRLCGSRGRRFNGDNIVHGAEALDCASRDRINIHGAIDLESEANAISALRWYELFDGLSCQEVAKVLLFDDDTIRVAGVTRTQAFRAKTCYTQLTILRRHIKLAHYHKFRL